MTGRRNANRVEHLLDQIEKISSSDITGVRNDLIESGQDPDELRQIGISLVRRYKGRERLSSAQKSRERLVEKIDTGLENKRRANEKE